MPHRFQLFPICICLMVLSACATLKEIVKEPEVTFKNVTPQNLSLTEGTFLFNFDVSNPNALGLTLSEVTYDLDINGKNFLKDKLKNGISLPAQGRSTMTIPVTVRYTDLFSSISDALKSDSVAYRIKGDIGIGPLSVPYKHQGKLEMPKLPDVSIADFSVSKLSFDGAAVKMKLRLTNPNDFGIDLNGLDYALKLQGQEIAKGIAKSTTPLTAKGESLMDLDINLSFKELGRSGMAILKGTGTQYEIKGNFLLNPNGKDEKQIPFFQSGEIPLGQPH